MNSSVDVRVDGSAVLMCYRQCGGASLLLYLTAMY